MPSELGPFIFPFMNAVLIAVLVMLVLAALRVHVVLALFVGSVVGGLISGIGLDKTMVAFQTGLAGGAKIALSYALLGAFAMAVASSGLPELLAQKITAAVGKENNAKAAFGAKWLMLAGILAMSVMSQNLIPVHIAFIPLIIPPLLSVMNKLRIDRRLVACVLTFGLVTTYMWIPVGFGSIFLNNILLANIKSAGMKVDGINVMHVMTIPALGMVAGLLIAVFFSYRKPREYADQPVSIVAVEQVSRYKVIVSLIAIVATFAVQVVMLSLESEADSLLVGSLVGLSIFMITAQGFAAVMSATGEVQSLVKTSAALFGANKALAALAMLVVGLIVTMGIGSSFSTLPIITTIYVPLCMSLGFSPAATVAIIGTAGALGDAGSPASDSTLGPTAGLNADGQHDHIRDSVIPTFLHFNLPLLASGWVAAMVL